MYLMKQYRIYIYICVYVSIYICMLFNVFQKYNMIQELLKLDMFSYSENIISLLYYLFRQAFWRIFSLCSKCKFRCKLSQQHAKISSNPTQIVKREWTIFPNSLINPLKKQAFPGLNFNPRREFSCHLQ